MKLVKDKSINRVGDERLESCLLDSASHVLPDTEKQRQASHRLCCILKNKSANRNKTHTNNFGHINKNIFCCSKA
jgi:hypothetical protein